jgi:hypothetical protein
MEKWWREEHLRFTWPGLPAEAMAAAAVVTVDPALAEIDQLGSPKGIEAQQAEGQLRSRGNAAIPALLVGMTSQSLIVRRHAYGILRDLTKHDIPYDPRADDGARLQAIDAWRTWLAHEKLIPEPPAAGDEGK